MTRRGGRSPERAERVREAPAAEDACPRHPGETENALRGCFGGMQGGPRRGRSPITGPALPHAAQASQTSPDGETKCPKGRTFNQSRREAKSRAAQASKTSPEGETKCPKGRKKQNLVSILYGAKIICQKCGINLHIHQCDRSVVFDVQIFCDYRLKRKSFEATAGYGIYASRREIT